MNKLRYTEVGHLPWSLTQFLRAREPGFKLPQFDSRAGTLNYYVSVLSETEYSKNTKGRILPGKIIPSFTIFI